MTGPRFHHANIKTCRLDEMIAWYGDAVGLEVVFRWPNGAFLSNDEASHRPHFTVDHRMTTSFYYADPDDNSIELQVDNFGSWAKSMEFMRSAPEFAADPIGVLVDPRRLIQARDEGASPWEVHERAYAGEFVPEAELDLRIPS